MKLHAALFLAGALANEGWRVVKTLSASARGISESRLHLSECDG